MSKVKFFLKDPKSTEETLIFLVFNHNYKRLKYSTGEYILPTAWIKESHSPDPARKYPHNPEIHRRLEEYRFFITDLVGELKRKKEEITPEKLRVALDKHFKVTEVVNPSGVTKVTLVQYIDYFIKNCEEGKRLTPKKTKYKGWTIKGFNTLLFHLKNYMNYTGRKYDFEDITIEFYDNLLTYFHEKDYATNTIGKQIKNIKVIMRASFDEGLHRSIDFQKKDFRIVTEDSDTIYLNEEELDKMYKLDLSKDPHLERVRDLFIVDARLGLRYSDLIRLKESNIFKKGTRYFIKIRTDKNNVQVTIPLKKEVIDIYDKYKGNFPRALSNQKMNESLKDIGKLADINTITNKHITKGGIGKDYEFEKWELITTHTARRSLATNLYLAGIPSISIMKITGHKTERSFMKYIRMSSEDNAFKMAENDYFKNDFIEETVVKGWIDFHINQVTFLPKELMN